MLNNLFLAPYFTYVSIFFLAENPIPGVAGVDYPTLSRPPSSPIKPCSTGVGYVADITSGCQVFNFIAYLDTNQS